MAFLAKEIAQFIIANNIAVEISEDVFIDYLPDDPANIISITEYPGSATQPGVDALQRRFQIQVRGSEDDSARERIWSIFNILSDPIESIINLQGREVVTQALQSPFKLMDDDKDRPIFVFNLSVASSRDY